MTVSRIWQAGTKVGYSDQLERDGKASNQKGSYARDNRVISSKSPNRRRSLPPRCWIIVTWGWRSSQGLDCSSIKTVRDLSLERRKTVRLISAMREKPKSRFVLYARTYKSIPLMYLLSISIWAFQKGNEPEVKRHSRVVTDKRISAEGI